jgi:large subunit ribosomal protein L5
MRKLQKICINYGVNGILDKNLIDISMNELKLITNQTPTITRSKKDISNFKLRKGMELGVKVTLRGRKMYQFLDHLIDCLLNSYEFKGLNANSFDKHGNYSMGIKDQRIFTEINIDNIKNVNGMDITFVTNCNKSDSLILLNKLNLPFTVDREFNITKSDRIIKFNKKYKSSE